MLKEFYQFVENDSPSWLAVVTAFGGVILGWGLEKITRFGKVKIFQKSVRISYLIPNKSGGHEVVTKDDNFTSYNVFFDLDFYNTSYGNQKILRDIHLLMDGNSLPKEIKKLLKSKGVNLKSRRNVERLTNLTLRPNELQNHQLVFGFDDSQGNFLNRTWYLEYCNNRNKIKRVKLDLKNL